MAPASASSLDSIDLVAIVLYLVGTIGFGLYKSRRASAEDYFLGGRGMTWPIIGLSMLATCVSSSSLVGWAGDAYATGISVFNYGIAGGIVVLVFFLWFFLGFYVRSGIYTMPEFLERRFDARSRYFFSFMTVVGYTFLDAAVTLYAGARMLQLCLPGLSLEQLIYGLAAVAASYAVIGGLSAVMWVDLVQATMLLVGSTLLTVIAFFKAGGWNAVMAAVPPAHLSLIRPADDPSVPWPALFLTLPLLGFYYWCTSQAMVQRSLSAKNLTEARLGNLFAAALTFAVFFVMVLPGVVGRILAPGLEKADLVYPTLVLTLMPPGMRGVIVVGFTAAMISTLGAILNSSSTLVTMDFVMPLRPGLSDRGRVVVGNVVGCCVAVVAAAWAPSVGSFDSLVKYFQQLLGYLTPPVVAVFLFGVFWPRANGHGALASFLTGIVLATGIIGNMILNGGSPNLPPLTSWHPFLYVPPLIFVVSSAALVVTSLATAPPDAGRIGDLLWQRSLLVAEDRELAETPWYRNYRIVSLVLLGLTAWFVFVWR